MKCTFSIEPDCFNAQNESEFLKAGKTLFAPSLLVGLKFLAVPVLPKWMIDMIPVSWVALIELMLNSSTLMFMLNKGIRID